MKKILIVDDSASMRKIVIRVLRQADIVADTFLEASSGNEGLQRLSTDPDVQLVLSDLNMPEMNGIDFVKAVRTRHDKEQLPMVMVTTEGGELMAQSALSCGANAYVTKPFTAKSIRAALEPFIR
jgi:two-component system chemotaxis response regulator CheY